MTRLRFLASLLILAAILLPVTAGCGPAPTPTPVPTPTATPLPQPITLTILHTNDTSGYLDPCG